MSRNIDKGTPAGHEPAALKTLSARLTRQKIAELDDLCRALRVSARTVFRLLKKAGYHSSYSHAGRYYTLVGTPRFDAFGLWHYDDVGFSKHGTLHATLVRLIDGSEAGRTQKELEPILGLRVHDTLRALVHERLVARHKSSAGYVYVSAKRATAKAQLAKRREVSVPAPSQAPPVALDAACVIEVLLAVIHKPRAGQVEIAASLKARGIEITDAQVEEIFRRYSLEKKTVRSRSRHSRR